MASLLEKVSMKILMIDSIASFALGRYDLNLCEALQSNKENNIELVVPRNCKFLSNSVKMIRIGNHTDKAINKYLRTYSYIWFLINIYKIVDNTYSCLHWQMGFICLIDKLFIKLLKHKVKKLKMVLTIHDIKPMNNTLNNILFRRSFMKGFDGYVLHSEENIKEFNEYLNKKNALYKIIRMGPLDKKEYVTLNNVGSDITGLPTTSCLILTLGTINRSKNIEQCLEIIRKIRKTYSHVFYVIAGYGDLKYAAKIKSIIKAFNEINYVSFINRELNDDEVAYLHQRACLSLYIYERCTTSGAIITSLCAGVPVICNDLPGMRAIIIDGYNGFIIKRSNSDNKIQELIRTIADKDAYNRIKANSMHLSDQISWKKNATEHNNLYKELVAIQ